MCIIFQNENVHRDSTCERLVVDLRRSDRRTSMKVLVKRTFKFVDEIWRPYVQTRINDLRYGTDMKQTVVHVHVLWMLMDTVKHWMMMS